MIMDAQERIWLTRAEVAERLGVTEQELRNWRSRGAGPAAVRFRRHLRYRSAVVARWTAESAREAYRARTRSLHQGNRTAVFDHYGWSCRCCGSTERPSIDHVNGDGGAHREQIGHGSNHMYRWLVAQGFPEGFQTLCLPCNYSKRDGERCRLDHEAARRSDPAASAAPDHHLAEVGGTRGTNIAEY